MTYLAVLEWFRKPLPDKTFDRTLLLLGHLFFFGQLLLSLWLYKERLLHFDAANYSFQLIYHEGLYIGHGRWISAPTQLLPLLAIKLGAPLKVILLSYSASFVLFFYLLFLFIVYVLKQSRFGIFLCLVLCLAMRYKFYGPVGEIVLSLGLLALLLAWLNHSHEEVRRRSLAWRYGWGLVLTALVVFTAHPFAAIGCLTMLGFAFLYHARWRDGALWSMTALALAGYGRKYLQLQKEGSYEAGQMDNLERGSQLLTQLPDLYVTDRILWYFETEYAFPFVIFMLALVLLAFNGKWLSAVFLLLAHIILLLAIAVAFSYLNDPVYILLDGYLSHLAVIWSLPVVYLLGRYKQVWAPALVAVLLLFGTDRIYGKRHFFQDREEMLLSMIEQHSTPEQRKLLHHIDHFDWPRLWLPWATSIETLMMTSLADPDAAATIYYKQHRPDEDEHLADPEFFYSLHYDPFQFEAERLPQHLFRLKPGLYKPIYPSK